MLFVGSLSLSIEYVFKLISQSYEGLSINWVIFPILIAIDFYFNSYKYFNKKVWKRIVFVIIPLILFLISGTEMYVPLEMTRFSLVKTGFNAIVIFIFFMVNSDSSYKRTAIIKGLLVGGIIGIFIQLLTILGFIPDKTILSNLKGLNVEVQRVSSLGDANQSIIYILSIASFIAYNNFIRVLKNVSLISFLCAGLSLAFVISTGSRTGLVAWMFVVSVSLILSWKYIEKKSKINLSLVLLFAPCIIVLLIDDTLLSNLKDAIFARWIYAVEFEDDSLGHRLQAYGWMFERIVISPPLVGMGYLRYHHEVGILIPGGESSIRYPHSSFVDSFIIGGIPLLLSYLFLWYKSFIYLLRLHKDKSINHTYKAESAFFLTLLCGILIISSFISIIWLKLTWAIFGIAFGLNKQQMY